MLHLSWPRASARSGIRLTLPIAIGLLLVGVLAAGLLTRQDGARAAMPAARPSANGVPQHDHVVIVLEENHAYSQIIGSASASYINSLAAQGALFTNSYAIEHPS